MYNHPMGFYGLENGSQASWGQSPENLEDGLPVDASVVIGYHPHFLKPLSRP